MLFFASLCVILLSGFAHAAELIESGPGEDGTERDQEITAEIPKIKVDVALATTDVTVIGYAVSELSAEDFIIYDNGVLQKISHFSRDVLPLAVVVLIDRSLSIEEYLSSLETAAISALKHLKPQDQVALLAFDDDVLRLSGFTGDHNLVARILGKLTIGSATNIYDAIVAAAQYLRVKAPNRRRAIIMLSDNCHTVSRGNRDRAQIEVLESSATLYSIKTPGENYSEAMRERDPMCYDSITMVKQIAAETGGEVLDVSASRSLQAALEKAASNLRLQYTLGFSPSNLGEDGSFHRLTVKLASEDRCPGCQLLVRSGYFAGIRAPLPAANHAPLISTESGEKIDPSLIRRRILAVGNIDADLPDVSFMTKTAGQKDPNGKQRIKIDLQVNFAGIGFKPVGNRHTCRLHIAVFYVDKKRDYFDSEWRTLEGQLKEETYNQVMRNGLSFSMDVPQKAPEQTLRIVIYDEVSASFGSKLVRFPQQ
jgi:Ca-activated chloride channel homolog